MQNLKDVDLELEKLVVLISAREGDGYLYGLIWELAYYDLFIEEKYKICREIVTSLMRTNLVNLEKFKDVTLNEKIEEVSISELNEILNNPTSWYPCNEIYALSLTKAGEFFLNNMTDLDQEKLNNRFTNPIR